VIAPPSHVLVTGGAGFIGSHLVEALLREGHHVTVLDDLSAGTRENLADAFAFAPDRVRLVIGDVRLALAPQLPGDDAFGPVARIVHLAAQVSVPASIAAPLADRATNLDGAFHVLDFARDQGVAKVVLASSAAIYGDGALPADEAALPDPESPYGVHKIGAEHYARFFAKVHGVPSVNLRFFNVYGPRQSPTSGYAGVISIFIAGAVSGAPLVIFGDGAQTRDFIWVGDIVRAIGLSLFAGPTKGEALNVGTGAAITLNQLAETIVRATSSVSTIEHGPPRVGDIVHSYAAVHRVHKRLGFKATMPSERGLALTAAWMQGGASSIWDV